MTEIQIHAAIKLVEMAKQPHYTCDDPWYNCPLSEEGCRNDALDHGKCNCGADKHNEEVSRLSDILQINPNQTKPNRD